MSGASLSNVLPFRRGGSGLRPTLVPVLLLLLPAWALHWRTFGVSELGQDGFLAVDLAVSPLSQMAAFLLRDVHPPLFYAALHGWFGQVGATYATARFLPIAAAMLSLATLYRLGMSLFGVAGGLLAAGLLIVSPAALLLSTTVRDFSPGLAVSLLTLWLMQRGYSDRPTRFAQIGLAAGTAAGLLTWYFHWCFFTTEALVLAMPAGRTRRAAPSSRRAVAVGRLRRMWPLLLGALLAAPWYVAFLPRVLDRLRAGTTAFGAAPQVMRRGDELTILTQAIVGWDADWLGLVATAAWLITLVIGIGSCLRPMVSGAPGWDGDYCGSGRRMLVVGLVLSSTGVTLVVWHWAQPVSLPKYMLAVLPFALLLQSVAIRRARPIWRTVARGSLIVAVLVQIVSAWRLVSGASIDWTHDAVADALAARLGPGNVAVFSDHAQRGQYLLARAWVGAQAGRTAVIQGANRQESYLHDTPQDARRIVVGLLPGTQRIWYVEAGEPAAGPHPGRAALASLAFQINRQPVGDADLQLYGVAAPDVHLAPQATLGGVATLLAADITGHAQPGGLVAVRLLWRDDHQVPGFYTAFVHLDNAAGRTVAQHDGIPMAGLRPTDAWRPGEQIDDRHGLTLPSDLAPGDYSLNAGLYLGQDRLPLPDGTNAIPLGRVHVGD